MPHMTDVTLAQPTSRALQIIELQRQAQALRQAFFAAGAVDAKAIGDELDQV